MGMGVTKIYIQQNHNSQKMYYQKTMCSIRIMIPLPADCIEITVWLKCWSENQQEMINIINVEWFVITTN